MHRDLSEIFMHDDEEADFTHIEEEMVLPISTQDSIIFHYDDSLKAFDFESQKIKAYELVHRDLSGDQFDYDIQCLDSSARSSRPSKFLNLLISAIAILELLIISSLFIAIWVLLILDIVILGLEIYFIKKLIKIIWGWRSNTLNNNWSKSIEKVLNAYNIKYNEFGLFWKFDLANKWIQLSKLKNN
jgi:hypothetical protein